MTLRALVLLVPLLLTAADLKIDHVTIAGKSLSAMEQQLAAAGLHFESGGAHSNHATEMAIASFPDGSYIELIAPQANYEPAALAAHYWGKFIEGNAGPCAWAVRPKDFDAEVARIRGAGVPVKVVNGGRKRPDGTEVKWVTGHVGNGGMGTFFPFLIRDETPRQDRAFLSGKPSNRDEGGILRVVIAVAKLSDALDRFRLVYPDAARPLKQVDRKFGAELAWIADSPVVFAAPLGADSRVGERIAQFGEGPIGFVLAGKGKNKGAVVEKAQWFGRDVTWLDSNWWIGVEE
jgi:hypothetical protein